MTPLRGTTLDPAAWIALAEELGRHDRIYGVPATHRRLAIFQQILADESEDQLPERTLSET